MIIAVGIPDQNKEVRHFFSGDHLTQHDMENQELLPGEIWIEVDKVFETRVSIMGGKIVPWVPPLDQAQNELWFDAQVKRRDILVKEITIFDETFDVQDITKILEYANKAMMSKLINKPWTVDLVSKSGETKTLNADQMIELHLLVDEKIQEIDNHLQKLREMIFKTTSYEELKNIDITGNWPE